MHGSKTLAGVALIAIRIGQWYLQETYTKHILLGSPSYIEPLQSSQWGEKDPSKCMKSCQLTDGQLDPGRGISNVSMVIIRVCARRGCLNMTLAEEFQILE